MRLSEIYTQQGGQLGIFCDGIQRQRTNYINEHKKNWALINSKKVELEDLKNGWQQKGLENLRTETVNLTNDILKLTSQLQQEETKTQAWQRQPEAFYNQYKALVLGLGSVWCKTSGRDHWEREKNKSIEELSKVSTELLVLQTQHKSNLDHYKKLKINKQNEKRDLLRKIEAEKQKQKGIMQAYELRKQKEEAQLRELNAYRAEVKALQAQKSALSAEISTNKSALSTQAMPPVPSVPTPTEEPEKSDNTLLYVAGAVIIGGFFFMNKGGNKVKVKV